jgi:primosomal protein N' (replication factor Y)
MILIKVRGVSLEKTTRSADLIAKVLRIKAPSSVEVSEASPAPLERAHGQYRYQVTLKAKSGVVLARLVREVALEFKLPEGIILTVDVDPYSLI